MLIEYFIYSHKYYLINLSVYKILNNVLIIKYSTNIIFLNNKSTLKRLKYWSNLRLVIVEYISILWNQSTEFQYYVLASNNGKQKLNTTYI